MTQENCNVTTEMNKFEVRRFQQGDHFILALVSRGRLVDMIAGKYDTEVTFFYISPDEMLALGNAICAEAYQAQAESARRNVEAK